MQCAGESYTESLPKYKDDIESFGQSIMHAVGNPGFTYTIGAASKGIPDIIISCNISYKYASHILNQYCAKLRSGDTWFGPQSDILANGLMTYLLPCDADTTILPNTTPFATNFSFKKMNSPETHL